MAKVQFQHNVQLEQILDDLEKYRDFCVGYGYVFNEATLYNMKNFAYQQYSKFTGHKSFRDNWAEDARRMNSVVVFED